MKRLPFLIPVLLFGLLAGVLWRGLDPRRDPQALPSPLIGQPAPALQRPRLLDPAQTWDSASLRGQVWVLNVFASWCLPCREELAVLAQFGRDTGLPIIGLNYKDAPEQAVPWLSQHGNPYTQIITDRQGQVGMDYGVYGVPETFLIDRDGIIRFKFAGPLTREVIRTDFLPQIQALQP